ncbi:MAG: M20/M25/M40 family metallo-hydrolase, partial [Bacteroidia bacterium]
DTDALPIQEVNTFLHKSKIKGVAHKCGHDGHSTIMCGVAMMLQKNALKNKAVLLFQPAEEIGEGAKLVMNHPNFKPLKLDYCYALHNMPAYAKGKIIVKNNAFTAAVASMVLKLNGKSAHAAEPEHGFNPSYAISKILLDSKKLIKPDLNSNEFTLITPTHGMFGDDFAYGTSAFYGELRLTIRAWTNTQLDCIKNALTTLAHKVCNDENIKPQIEWTQEFRANINHNTALKNVISAAQKNNYGVIERPTPFKWGEDFGLFTEHIKGCMFGVGSGADCPALHNPDYDFPDDITPIAAQVFFNILSN